jgi:Putative MetA-pathway of phenol degradation
LRNRKTNATIPFDSHANGGTMRRAVIAGLFLAVQTPLAGQSLSDHFRDLFTFGDCGEPLCLTVGTTFNHGGHYIPSATQGEKNMLAFVTGSIATSLGNLPFTAASSGITFNFVGGAPVATSVSAGPIFGERSQTLGRGRVLAGLNVNGASMANLRGIPLSELVFKFAHVNVGEPALGDPSFERDIIEVKTDLSLSLLVTSVFASYGLMDNVDIGVLVPVVRASIDGTSDAQIVTSLPNTPHLFDQPTPSTRASSASSGSAVGIGDVAIRAKINVRQTTKWGAALIADARLPTGDADNFLGSGNTSVRALAVVSGSAGNFAPHANAGFAFRTGDNQNKSLLGTVGFDQLVSSRITLAMDVIADLELGASKLVLPDPVIFTAPDPTPVIVSLTDIPDQKDNLIDASFGLKFALANEFRAVSNILVPLNNGGLRPKFLWTVGLERTF